MTIKNPKCPLCDGYVVIVVPFRGEAITYNGEAFYPLSHIMVKCTRTGCTYKESSMDLPIKVSKEGS